MRELSLEGPALRPARRPAGGVRRTGEGAPPADGAGAAPPAWRPDPAPQRDRPAERHAELREELVEELRRRRLTAEPRAEQEPEPESLVRGAAHAVTRERSLRGEAVDALANDRPPEAGRARAARAQARIQRGHERLLEALTQVQRARRAAAAQAYRETAASLVPEAEL